MKKWILLVVFGILTLGVVGCGTSNEKPEKPIIQKEIDSSEKPISKEEVQTKARKDLAQLNIPYNEASFQNTVVNSDMVAVKLFLKAGMNANVAGRDGTTALIYAVQHKNAELVQVLLDSGADPNLDGNSTFPLKEAVVGKQVEIAKTLLAAKADPNKLDVTGESMLMLSLDQKEMVKILLNAKADPNYKYPGDGNTALTWAKVNGDKDVEQMLIEAGAKE